MKKFLQTRFGVISLTAAGIVLLIAAQRIGILRPIENVFTTVFEPVQSFFTAVSQNAKGLAGYFNDVKSLREENERLQEEVAALTGKNLALENSLDDAGIIRAELDFVNSIQYESVPAKIIGRSSDEFLQSVIINKGDRDGIQNGYPVISGSGVLIGKIIDTNSSIAKVLLLNDNQSQVSGIIQNEAKSPGIVKGQFGISLVMQLIPQGDSVSQGSVVTTSGLEESIPADLLIGRIGEVRKIEGELFQETTIEPLVEYNTMRIVTVILPFNDQE
ncbi:MAG: rod shape-determining protein MreC [Patescibacteria group bacterium]